MTKQDILKISHFALARRESLKVNFHVRVGAVLVRQHCTISTGKNYPTKTHPLIRKYSNVKTIHAEFDAVIGIDRHLVEGSYLYVYRETRDGKIAMAKPCDMCLAFLIEMGVRKIFYTNHDGYETLII
jgi:deoxycytidylate deaminase